MSLGASEDASVYFHFDTGSKPISNKSNFLLLLLLLILECDDTITLLLLYVDIYSALIQRSQLTSPHRCCLATVQGSHLSGRS